MVGKPNSSAEAVPIKLDIEGDKENMVVHHPPHSSLRLEDPHEDENVEEIVEASVSAQAERIAEEALVL